MRVLHVYRTYYPDAPGGIQEAIRQIALSTREYGVESHVFTLSPQWKPTRIDREEATIVRARSWAAPASCDLGDPGAMLRFRHEARRADLVHYHFPWPYADLLQLFASPGTPAVMTYHSDIINKGRALETLYRPLMKAMLRRMRAVIATSPPYARSSEVLARYVTETQLRVIPLGILESSYAEARVRSKTLDPAGALGLERDGYFLFVGGLRGYKGLETLAAAAGKAPLPIVIAGDGRERAVVERMERDHSHVHRLVDVDEGTKLALLRDCRALILPSDRRSEAFGMVLVEAAMMGRPAISTRLDTGTTYVNRHDETGQCVEPGDPDALVQAMHALMDTRHAAQWGHNARRRYEEHFSGKALGRRHADLYREILVAT